MTQTTPSNPSARVAPNRLNRDFRYVNPHIRGLHESGLISHLGTLSIRGRVYYYITPRLQLLNRYEASWCVIEL